MKIRLFIVFAIVFSVALTWLDAYAAPATSSVTGVIYDGAGNPVPNATIYFNSLNTQVVQGTTIYPILVSSTTDVNGNLSTTALDQGLFVQITICQLQGGGCGAPTTGFVPISSSVTFQNLLTGTAASSSSTLTGNLNAAGFKITSLGANTTTGDALSQGQSTLNNLTTATGNYAMGSHKFTGLVAGTGSGDSLAYGLNTLNSLAAATGNYAMGSNKLTGLIAGTTSGDSLAFGLNDLSQLAAATSNYAMGGNRITGLAAPVTTGDALSEGNNIGAITPIGVITVYELLIKENMIETMQTLAESGGGTLTPNGNNGPDVFITLADNSAWTLTNPTNLTPSSGLNSHWWIRIRNNSGGSAGTITLGTSYRTDTSWSSTGPGSGKTRVCPVLTEPGATTYIGPCTADETN